MPATRSICSQSLQGLLEASKGYALAKISMVVRMVLDKYQTARLAR